MKMKTMLLILTLLVVPLSGTALAFNYISAAQIKQNLTDQVPMTLIDIQVEADFAKHHIVEAIPTHAFPVKTDADRQKLAPAIAKVKDTQEMVIIVCPRGRSGAQGAFNHLVESGIDENRVYILTDGQAAWPYPELLAR